MNHFNQLSKEWDRPEKIEQNIKYAKIIKSHLVFNHPIAILDLGCGTGLLGQQFVEEENTLMGIDTSEGMLDVFNKKFLGNNRVSSRLLNLEKENVDAKFDLILSSMAFHHMDDPMKMVLKLKKLLTASGALAIIDLDLENGSFHSDPKNMGVKHFGFSKEVSDSWAREAGFSRYHRETINIIKKENGDFPVFLSLNWV